ncbi:hypothetical protein DL98DRAFT_506869 [Cadophora sp. DSE1049]|nr:hypothetical protein DL98DRAFT_506869 [Cadophora sp. DSE1049]
MTRRLRSHRTAMVHTAPLYLASSASSSFASVWSDAPSQSSNSSDSNLTPCCISHPAPTFPAVNVSVPPSWSEQKVPVELALEQRHHPRRTSAGTKIPSRCPSLLSQSNRKVQFVDSLVDFSVQIIEAIWPLSSVACRSEMGNKAILPLRTFIQETLRRSRTSYSTLQVILYYLILIKPYVPEHDFTMEQPVRALQCGRRMFLSALILASKYLQDRNYSARAWNKISGLNTLEINQNEIAFLFAVNWRIHITDAVSRRWTDIVLKYTSSLHASPGAGETADWKAIILQLNSDLDNIKRFTISAPSNFNVQLNIASPQPFGSLTVERSPTVNYGSTEPTPTPKHYMEHPPSSTYPLSKPTPVLGRFTTPRLTPQSNGFNTPAVSAASYMLYKPAMDFATAPVSSIYATQVTHSGYQSSSQAHVFARRSSLADSASSSMPSPESMISDSSPRPSHSSSISSAEGCSDNDSTCLLESYTGLVGKDFLDTSLDRPLAKWLQSVDSPKVDAKRSLPESFDQSLQMLNDHFQCWSADLIRSRMARNPGNAQVAFESTSSALLGRKRRCCALEATSGLPQTNLHPALSSFGGPGM